VGPLILAPWTDLTTLDTSGELKIFVEVGNEGLELDLAMASATSRVLYAVPGVWDSSDADLGPASVIPGVTWNSALSSNGTVRISSCGGAACIGLGIAKTLVGSFLDLKTELTTRETSGEVNIFVEIAIEGPLPDLDKASSISRAL
jgi:hypothetical protein